MSKQDKQRHKMRIKILKFCASSAPKIAHERASAPEILTLTRGTSILRAVPEALLNELVKKGLVALQGGYLQTTRPGKMHLRRLLAQVDEFQQQHRLPGTRKIATNGTLVTHRSNEGESPLSRLRYRPTTNGEAYIDAAAFQAGERLRVDFTKGQLTQQLTSNWNVTQYEAGGSNGRNGIADLNDNALGARGRTQAAIKAVGPEFAGVLIDICCFLKGLELVETERRWPPRSAKLMLKTGLSILARHYGLTNDQKTNRSKSTPSCHWGSKDFKPSMFPDQ